MAIVISDSILALRDQIGAAYKLVKLVTRTWSGTEIGEGFYNDDVVDVLPSPRVVEFTETSRVLQGGFVKAGDILLKMISKNVFDESDLDCVATQKNVEKFYDVGGVEFQVIKVAERIVTFNVHLRRRPNVNYVPVDSFLLSGPDEVLVTENGEPIVWE